LELYGKMNNSEEDKIMEKVGEHMDYGNKVETMQKNLENLSEIREILLTEKFSVETELMHYKLELKKQKNFIQNLSENQEILLTEKASAEAEILSRETELQKYRTEVSELTRQIAELKGQEI